MTEEVCARPGCGHTAQDHDGDGCCEDVPGTQDQKPRPECPCPCPSYRTQLQQEALDELRACHRPVTDEYQLEQCVECEWAWPCDVARLLELYL